MEDGKMSENGAAPRSDADLEELRVALVKLHSEGAPYRVFHGACAISELMMARNHARQEIADLTAENTRIRAALAQSKDACVYCQLPADEMAKCSSGFPGCARADDLTGCPEFGAAMRAMDLEAALRPFAEVYREGSFGDDAVHTDLVHLYTRESYLARAAELVPEKLSQEQYEAELRDSIRHGPGSS
jgi:hypothetical protein